MSTQREGIFNLNSKPREDWRKQVTEGETVLRNQLREDYLKRLQKQSKLQLNGKEIKFGAIFDAAVFQSKLKKGTPLKAINEKSSPLDIVSYLYVAIAFELMLL